MRLPALLLILSSIFGIAFSQTPAEVEKRLAEIPPDQKAYERFRYWMSTRSQDELRAGDPLKLYRDYLKTQGFSQNDIDTQIRIVEERGRQLEVQRWNRILTADKPIFNVNPNAFLVEMTKDRKPGTALDVGMGQGRNAIWLAQQGWNVTGFDPADKAVALANQTAAKLGVHLQTEVKDSESFDFGENRWDLILICYAGGRDLTARVERALKPHGILVIEAFHRDATKNQAIGSGVVFDTGDLPKLFPGLRVVRYEEPMATADFGQQRMRLVRYCAEKQE
jgi:2-polyprenyl-3-methyl-5-hydroxy-6-metoxy-1,4-benzoquinol methylase